LRPTSNSARLLEAWDEDPLDEVHYDDALWAYTIKAFEDWKARDVDHWNDPIIDRLFLMGGPDWHHPDAQTNAGIQTMRFGLVVLSRLQKLIHQLEDKVRLPSLL
jgi:hypothetical protein